MTTSHRNNAATSYDVMFTEYLYAAFHRKEDTRNDLCYIVISISMYYLNKENGRFVTPMRRGIVSSYITSFDDQVYLRWSLTGLDGAMAKLLGDGFASRYRLTPRG